MVSKKKRKNRSPGELGEGAAVRSDKDGRKLRKLNEGGDNSSRPATNKWPSSRSVNPPALSSGGRSAAAASAGAVSQQRITGKSTQRTTLKASAILSAPVEKATFFISNVEMKCGEKDIRRHCVSLGVRILFCFDITAAGAEARSFKLAVPASAANLIMDAEAWPCHIRVRPWRTTTTRRVDRVMEGSQGSSHEGAQCPGRSGARSPVESGREGSPLKGRAAVEITTCFPAGKHWERKTSVRQTTPHGRHCRPGTRTSRSQP